MASNPWDNSGIILSSQSGANWARGIEQVGSAFSKGVQGYFERKQQKEKEEATVDWINQNEQATNVLFPQLANVKDPAERRKAIKAGIKGAGLENLVQVRGFMEQQRRAQQMEDIDREMAQERLAGARLANQDASALMEERQAESAALRAASGGGPAGQSAQGGEIDRARIYMEMGGRNPQMIQALTKTRPFSPQEFMTPSGLNMVQTSPNSFVPDPRVRNKPTEPKTGEYERIVSQLEDAGAFDKPEEKLTSKEKALFARMKALNTRGTGGTGGTYEIPGIGTVTIGADGQPSVGGGGAGASSAAAKPSDGAPVKISTRAERDALPPGTPYIAPDGKTYIKQ